MKASQVIATIKEAYRDNIVLMIHGPSGAGKSDCIKQAVREIAAEQNMPDFGFIDWRAALLDAVDVGGMPYIENGITKYSTPAQMPLIGSGLLCAEEVNMAHPQTQGALYQFFLDRGIGSYRLPKGWLPIATGNRAADRGVTHRMPDPLNNRFEHVDFEVDLGEFCRWGLTNGILPEIIAFLRFRPNLLHSHNPARECHAFATPRSWAVVSKLLAGGSQNENERIRGNVGDEAGGELIAFLKLYRNMVSPDQILLNPLKADVPNNGAILYALAEALARRATAKNLDAVLTYAKRMPSEYAQALVSSATHISPALCSTHEFIAWAASQEAQAA